MEIRFTKAARKHRVGRGSVRHVMARVTPIGTTTSQGNPGWRYVGTDERGRELEIIAVELQDDHGDELLLVIHVLPTSLRGSGPDV